ncbi:WPP domain-interacting protein 1-like [Panicum miliaceum]|uniref:WPP domain-interacting protein 1-like n=1 Tax=Panicum miliaceum TaxID=4540 RepID=A0A3L6PPL1_PANMI|nr:WPP domain-interacting protein 1-like [Panicum miliaceum]
MRSAIAGLERRSRAEEQRSESKSHGRSTRHEVGWREGTEEARRPMLPFPPLARFHLPLPPPLGSPSTHAHEAENSKPTRREPASHGIRSAELVPPAQRRGCSAPPLMRSMDSVASGPVESSAESRAPAAEAAAEEEAVPKSSPAAAATKGRGLRRWRRIRRGQEQQREGYASAAAAVGGGGAGDEDSAQLHKRRLPLPAGATKGKHEAPVAEAESSTASVESRFVPPGKLDPGLGLLVAPAGFSVGASGAESDNSEDGSSKSSTAASAPRVLPRHEHALLFQRERDRLSRSRAPAASLHGRNPRAARSRADRPRVVYSAAVSTEADNSRSSVESDLRSSNALKLKARQSGAGVNGVHKVFSDYCELSDEEQPSEEVRSTGYCKDNGSSVVGRSVQINVDSGNGVEDTFDEASVGKGQNGRMHSGADHYNESTLLLLQRTQEALENEIEKIMAIGKEPTGDFDVHDDEWSGSVHLEEPFEEVNERIKHLESRLVEASALIKEKASRIHELEATTIENTDLLSQSELDQLYQEKMEAEIQCTILTRAYQASVTLAEDQMALYEAQKSLSEDYKQLGLKLRHNENRAMVLEEMAEKLQVKVSCSTDIHFKSAGASFVTEPVRLAAGFDKFV